MTEPWQPPARSRQRLQRALHPRSAAFVTADLDEDYRDLRARRGRLVADAWYRVQAFTLGARYLRYRLRHRTHPHAPETASMFDSLRQDLAPALRSLASGRQTAIIALVTLAVGIGASAAIFSVVYGVLRALPYPGGERIVLVYEGDAEQRTNGRMLSPAELLAVDDLEGAGFDVVAAYSYNASILDGAPNPERISAPRITHDFLDMLGQLPVEGRDFAISDRSEDRLVILGHALWQRRYGGDPSVVGQKLILDGEAHTILGVSAPEFDYFNDTNRLFLLLAFDAEARADVRNHNVYPLVRVADDTKTAAVEAQVAAVVASVQTELGHSTTAPHGVWLYSLYDAWVGSVRGRLLVLLGAVGVLVLVACANVAGLQLARGLDRGREIALRLALGARRGRIVRLLVAESLMLGVAGGAVGFLIAVGSVGWLRSLVQSQLPRTDGIAVDARVFAFAFALSLLVGAVAGVVPAWAVTRRSLAVPLAEGSVRVGRLRGSVLQASIQVTQVAMAVLLTVAALLLARSFRQLQSTDLGFRPDGIVANTLVFYGLDPAYREPHALRAFTARLLDRIEGFPGVEASGIASVVPGDPTGFQSASAFEIDGAGDAAEPERIAVGALTPGVLEALDIPVRGRTFVDTDIADAAAVAIVSESLARRLWPGRDAIGRQLRQTAGQREGPWATIVGVAGDVHSTARSARSAEVVYLPYAQSPSPLVTILARLDRVGDDFTRRLRALVAEIDPVVPVNDTRSLETALGATIASDRLNGAMMSTFALVALVLVVVGQYALAQNAVARRRREIAVRVALGAPAARIRNGFLRGALGLTGTGVLIGLAAAWFAGGVLRSLLFGVEPTDLATYLAVALTLMVVGAIACLGPSRRAARLDPAATLRRD